MKRRTFAAIRKRTISGHTHFRKPRTNWRSSARAYSLIDVGRAEYSDDDKCPDRVLQHLRSRSPNGAGRSRGRGERARQHRAAATDRGARRGAQALSAQDAYVRAQQAQADIPVVTHDDLRWADGIAWGTPTRYGNMSAQMKQFVD